MSILRPFIFPFLRKPSQSFRKASQYQLNAASFHSTRFLLRILPDMAGDERPTGLKANKGIELLTFGTPNGWKASIILEELKEAYGKDYTYQSINISQNIQKEEWFTKLGPNGRMYVHIRHSYARLFFDAS
jgi:glutathione S-transferase